MCGICGIYCFEPLKPSDHELVRKMTAALVHRGPDDEGYYFDQKVGLGMRRLSIIDLVSGHQPIHNESQDIWTIYNGEIYNFPELRKRLIKKGHEFYTGSDTEVIIHLYEEEGENFVNELNGMFAIALWDKKKGELLLVRDRLGVKPLHYLLLNNQFYFSSEIKSLLKTGYQKEMDFEGLSQFFTFEYIPAPKTIFKGIKKLLPGEMMIVRDNVLKTQTYWDLRYEQEPGKEKSEEDYQEEIYRRLKESVRMRLISDVPLGVFLSGGIDSSTVTALMSEVSTKIKTFSIGFREKSFNELDYAHKVASFFGTDHREFIVESNLVKELVPVLMNYLDEPLADASIIPSYIISKLARQYVTVALAGEGGDELFAGYDTYKAYKVAQFYRKVPRFIRKNLVKKAVNLLPASKKRLSFEFKAKKFILGVEYPPEIANFIWWGAYTPQEKERLFSAELNSLVQREQPYLPIFFHLKNCKAREALDKLGYLDLKLYLQDDLLVKADRMSMANSLEIRVPFLDYTFVEFASSIPSSLKLRGWNSKYILKKTIQKLLPREILSRRKIGFDIPLGVWIKNELRDFVTAVLSPSNLKKHNLFNSSYVSRLLDEHFQGTHNHRQLLWPLIIFQFWYDSYLR